MPMNLRCAILVGSVRSGIEIEQVPDEESRWMLAGENGRRLWQETARMYLAWVAATSRGDRDRVKGERRKIGRAWRTAEQSGGRLSFSIG